jgi:hypothetical protein
MRGHKVLYIVQADLVCCTGPKVLPNLRSIDIVLMLVLIIIEHNFFEIGPWISLKSNRGLLSALSNQWPLLRIPIFTMLVIDEWRKIFRLIIITVRAVIWKESPRKVDDLI